MAEEVLYHQGDITLTPLRLVAGRSSYALQDISHAEVGIVKASKRGPVITLSVAVMLSLWGLYGLIDDNEVMVLLIGLLVGWIGLRWHKAIKDAYSVRLISSTGLTDEIRFPDKASAQQLVQAVNQAIIQPGG
jgi:hypothetical protein